MTQAFHLKYRPTQLGKLIGHEDVVTRLQGMIKSGKVPNALMFVGPSSAGKTTLARCVAAALNEVESVKELTDYKELNGTDQKSIDDIRSLINISKFKPRNKKRVIVIDEFQGVLSNAQAAAALLKPLEEPSADTLWILCTMDPTKLGTGNGKAIANRCTQFVLKPHTEEDLLKQAKRIAKREKMDYALPILETVVQSSNGEMRTLANMMQAVNQFYDGLEEKPSKLKPKHVQSVITTTESSDDQLVAKVLTSLYQGKYAGVLEGLLDVQDEFRFVTMLLETNEYLMLNTALKGQRHPSLRWYLNTNKLTVEAMKKAGVEVNLGQFAAVNEVLVETKTQAMGFATSAKALMSAKLYRAIKTIFKS